MRRFVVVLGAFILALHILLLADDGLKPVPIRLEAPTYPLIARSARVQGTVEIEVTVAPDGTVVSAAILKGNPMLLQEAKSAVMRWKFDPIGRTSKQVVQLEFKISGPQVSYNSCPRISFEPPARLVIETNPPDKRTTPSYVNKK